MNMSGAEDSIAAPPLGPELASGKWRVRVIDADAKITEQQLSGKVWSMQNQQIMVDFNRKGQPIKDSGGLFGSWLGSQSTDLNILPINYTDWRKVPKYRKEMAWKVIQRKFLFDDPRKRRKYVISILGCRCRDLKQRLWKAYRKNTIQEAFDARPGLVPEDQWKEFVEIQFTDKAKKMRESNIISRSKLKIPHALGKKSIARMADEIEEETGREPSRSEIFIASRCRSDGSFICDEARISVEKLKQVMTEGSIQGEAHNAYEQVFDPENPGRVRCVGHGLTPSKYFSNLENTSSAAEMIALKTRLKDLEGKLETMTNLERTSSSVENLEMIHLKAQMKDLEKKLDIVADAVCKLVEQFQGSAGDENKKRKTNLQKSSSINSDQESGISKSRI